MVVLAAHHHGFFGRLFGTDVAAEVERELGTASSSSSTDAARAR